MREQFGHFVRDAFSAESEISGHQLYLLNHLVNFELLDYDSYMKLYNDQMEVDYQLVGDGIVVTDEYISVVADGTFRPFTHDERRIREHSYPREIPVHLKGEEYGSAQIIISDYTMDSIASAAEDLGWFDRSFQIKASTVDTYISDLEVAFGSMPSDLIDIVCSPIKG